MTEQWREFWFEGREPRRLDRFLADAFQGAYSRTQIQSWIREGRVRVQGTTVTRPAHRLDGPARIEVRVPPPPTSPLTPQDIPIDVLFENQDVVVVNKPAGMVVHPSPGHWEGTLVNALLARIPDLQGVGGPLRPGIVHRLDKETSGVMVVAKHEQALRFLQEQFKARQVRKVYWALVEGHPPQPAGRVTLPLMVDPDDRRKMRVTVPGQGKPAETEYRVLERFPRHALVEFRPITGRTHQIRVHAAFLGCPLVGDTLYGRRRPTLPVARTMLHALRLTLRLPGEAQPRTFEARLPEDFATALALLREQVSRETP